MMAKSPASPLQTEVSRQNRSHAKATQSEEPEKSPLETLSTPHLLPGATPNHCNLHDVDKGEFPINFGRYRIERLLGRGGMGSVFLASDTRLNRQVALKVPKFSPNDSQERQRFLREAQLAATLEHPNLCRIYDAGELEGTPYLTMAFIEGRPLSDLIKTGTQLPERPVADLIRKLAVALQVAHERGIVHRDLKPANIMVNRDHQPVVMDFGLARPLSEDQEQLTAQGDLLGTPAYMPPEQVQGQLEKIGPRSDIYSLGVVLYELLAGQRPFSRSLGTLFTQILRDEPRPLSQFRPNITPGLESICQRALCKCPEDRFESMGEFA